MFTPTRLALVALLVALPALATPPEDPALRYKYDRPLGSNPEIKTASIGTTPVDAIAADLSTSPINFRVDNVVQQILVSNRSTTATVCFWTTTWALTCAALTTTCSGAATDGQVINSGTQRAFVPDGTRRPCVVASAAATTVTVERVAR